MEDRNRNTMEDVTFGQWFYRAWGESFLKMMGLNALFLLACVPVVTIPAALCGLNSVVIRLYRDIPGVGVWEGFRKEFAEAFLGRTAIAFGVLAVPAVGIWLLSNAPGTAFGLVLCAVLVLAALLVLSWFIPQLVMLNLTPLQALKNACILMLIESKRNFLLILLHSVELVLMVFFLPLSGFALLFLPALHAVLAAPVVVPVLYQRLTH